MSYPRTWQCEKRAGKLRDSSLTNQTCIFHAEDGSRMPLVVDILVYKEPPKYLTEQMASWPENAFGRSTYLDALPTTLDIDEPIVIGEVRGFVSLTNSIDTMSIQREGSGLSVEFQTPKGDYVKFRAFARQYGTNVHADEDKVDEPMRKSIPILDAMLRSITFPAK